MGVKWAGDRYVRTPKVKRIGFRDPAKCYRCQEPVVGPPQAGAGGEVSVSEHVHEYAPLPTSAYFKKNPTTGINDQTRAFLVLFCRFCGETKEVVAMDHEP